MAAFSTEMLIDDWMKPAQAQGTGFQEKIVQQRVFHCVDVNCGLQKAEGSQFREVFAEVRGRGGQGYTRATGWKVSGN